MSARRRVRPAAPGTRDITQLRVQLCETCWLCHGRFALESDLVRPSPPQGAKASVMTMVMTWMTTLCIIPPPAPISPQRCAVEPRMLIAIGRTEFERLGDTVRRSCNAANHN